MFSIAATPFYISNFSTSLPAHFLFFVLFCFFIVAILRGVRWIWGETVKYISKYSCTKILI